MPANNYYIQHNGFALRTEQIKSLTEQMAVQSIMILQMAVQSIMILQMAVQSIM